MTEKNKDITYGDVELTEEERQAKQGKIRVSTMVDEDVAHKYRELEQENQRLRAEIEALKSQSSKVSMLVEALNYTVKRIDSYFAGQKTTTIDLHMIMETAREALKEWEK